MNVALIHGGHCMELTQEMFELIFPQDVFKWCALTEGTCDENTTASTFEEKDIPHSPTNTKTTRSWPENFTRAR